MHMLRVVGEIPGDQTRGAAACHQSAGIGIERDPQDEPRRVKHSKLLEAAGVPNASGAICAGRYQSFAVGGESQGRDFALMAVRWIDLLVGAPLEQPDIPIKAYPGEYFAVGRKANGRSSRDSETFWWLIVIQRIPKVNFAVVVGCCDGFPIRREGEARDELGK